MLTNPFPGGQWWRFDSINQQLAQQFGHKCPLQVDVDEAWENITNIYRRKELTWQGTTSTQQLHTKTSTSNFRKLLLKSKKAPETGNSSYLVRRSRFSGWARFPEGSWWSSLRSLWGWLSFLLPSASEAPQVKNKPIPKFLQHTTFVSKTKLQVTPGWGEWLESLTWAMAMALLHW